MILLNINHISYVQNFNKKMSQKIQSTSQLNKIKRQKLCAKRVQLKKELTFRFIYTLLSVVAKLK